MNKRIANELRQIVATAKLLGTEDKLAELISIYADRLDGDEDVTFEVVNTSAPAEEPEEVEAVEEKKKQTRNTPTRVFYPGYVTDFTLSKVTGKSIREISKMMAAHGIRKYFLGKKVSSHYHVTKRDAERIYDLCGIDSDILFRLD